MPVRKEKMPPPPPYPQDDQRHDWKVDQLWRAFYPLNGDRPGVLERLRGLERNQGWIALGLVVVILGLLDANQATNGTVLRHLLDLAKGVHH